MTSAPRNTDPAPNRYRPSDLISKTRTYSEKAASKLTKMNKAAEYAGAFPISLIKNITFAVIAPFAAIEVLGIALAEAGKVAWKGGEDAKGLGKHIFSFADLSDTKAKIAGRVMAAVAIVFSPVSLTLYLGFSAVAMAGIVVVKIPYDTYQAVKEIRDRGKEPDPMQRPVFDGFDLSKSDFNSKTPELWLADDEFDDPRAKTE